MLAALLMLAVTPVANASRYTDTPSRCITDKRDSVVRRVLTVLHEQNRRRGPREQTPVA